MKKNINMKYSILLILFVFSLFVDSFAQKDTVNAYNENVVVVGSFNPQLTNFLKKDFNPTIASETENKAEMQYSIFAQPLKIDYSVSPIKPAKMTGEPFDKLYANYIRVGFGTGVTPYGELFVNNKRDKKKNLGLHLKHFSSRAKIFDHAFTGFSNNQADVFGSIMKKNYTLKANIFVNRDVVYYYGFRNSIVIDKSKLKDTTRQIYTDIGTNMSWFSTHTDSLHVNYGNDFSYHYFWNIDNANENSLDLNGFVNKKINWLKKITKHQEAGMKYGISHYFQDRENMKINAGLVKLAPYLSTKFGPITLELSPKFYIETDTSSMAYFLPNIKLELDLLPSTLSAFGGLDGDLEYNSFRLTANKNQFIHHQFLSDYSIYKQIIFGGIKGSIGKDFSYNIVATNKKIENGLLFFNDSINKPMESWMGVIYDDISWFRAEFNSSLRISKKWAGYLSFAYNQAEAKTEAKAWYIPNFDGSVGIEYNLADKFLISSRLFFNGQRFAKPSWNDAKNIDFVELKPFFDVNLTIEYRYSKVLSAFLEFNNIAAQRYIIWNNYPSYKFRFLGGVTYSF